MPVFVSHGVYIYFYVPCSRTEANSLESSLNIQIQNLLDLNTTVFSSIAPTLASVCSMLRAHLPPHNARSGFCSLNARCLVCVFFSLQQMSWPGYVNSLDILPFSCHVGEYMYMTFFTLHDATAILYCVEDVKTHWRDAILHSMRLSYPCKRISTPKLSPTLQTCKVANSSRNSRSLTYKRSSSTYVPLSFFASFSACSCASTVFLTLFCGLVWFCPQSERILQSNLTNLEDMVLQHQSQIGQLEGLSSLVQQNVTLLLTAQTNQAGWCLFGRIYIVPFQKRQCFPRPSIWARLHLVCCDSNFSAKSAP